MKHRRLRYLIFALLFLCQQASLNAQWIEQPSPTKAQLQSVQILNAQEAVIGGSEGIYRTEDGGKKWKRYRLQANTADSLYIETMNTNHIYFTGSKTGFAAGWNIFNHSMILKTTDGGINWKIVYFSPSLGQTFDISFRAITFANQNVGYVAGTKGKVLKTVDAGETWESVSVHLPASDVEGSYFNSVFFVNEAVGYVAGSRLYQTLDGGKTWHLTAAAGLPGRGDFQDVHFFDIDNGLASLITSTDHGAIYKTTDGGQNWEPVQQPGVRDAYFGPAVINDLYFLDRQTGFAAGDKVAWKTTDGGETWGSANFAPSVNLQSVHFYDAAKGMMVGDNGKIYTTGNLGGATKPLANFSLPAAPYCPSTTYTFQNKGPDSYTYKWYINGLLAATSYNLTASLEPDKRYEVKLVSEHNGLSDYTTKHIESEKQETLRQFSLAYYNPADFYCKPAPVKVTIYGAEAYGTRYELWAEGRLIESILTDHNNYSALSFKETLLSRTTTYTVKAIKKTPCQTLTQEASITFRAAPQPNLALEVEELEEVLCPADGSKLSIKIKNSEPGFLYGIKSSESDISFDEYEGNGGDLIIPTGYTGGEPGWVRELPVNVRYKNCRITGGSSTNFTLQDKAVLRTSDFKLKVKLTKSHLFVNEQVEVVNQSVAEVYKWTVTDGPTKTVYNTPQLPRLTFATPGIKTIVLAIASHGKCADSTRMELVVATPAPVAALNVCTENEVPAAQEQDAGTFTRIITNHIDQDGFHYTTGSQGGRFVLSKYDSSGKLIWMKNHLNGAYRGSSLGTAIASDREGNVYVGGHYNTVKFSLGTFDLPAESPQKQVCFIVKLDQAGNILWAIQAAVPYPKHDMSFNYITDLALDKDQHIYAVFKTSSNIRLKFPDGSVQDGVYDKQDVAPTYILKTNREGKNLGTTLLLNTTVSHDENKLSPSSYDYLWRYYTSPQIEIDSSNKMYIVGSRITVVGEAFTIGGYVLPAQQALLQRYPEGGIQGYVAVMDLNSGTVEKAFNTFFHEAKDYGLPAYGQESFAVPFALTPNGIIVGYNWDANFTQNSTYQTYTTAKELLVGGVTHKDNFSGSLTAAYNWNGGNVWAAASHGAFVNSLHYSPDSDKLYAYAQLDSLSIIGSAAAAGYAGIEAGKGRNIAMLIYAGGGKLEGVWQPSGQTFGAVPYAMAADQCESVYLVSGIVDRYDSNNIPFVSSRVQFRAVSLSGRCSSMASVSVPFTQKQICRRESVQLRLDIPASSQISWSPATGLDNPESAAPVATPAVSTTYIATVETADGCTVKRAVQINVDEPLVLPDAFTAVTKAFSTSVDFKFPAVEGGTNYSYQWDFGDGTTSSNQKDVYNHTYRALGTYTVCLTISNSCTQKTVCQEVTVPCRAPAAEIAYTSTNKDVSFQLANAQHVESWEWDFADGTKSSERNPVHTYTYGAYVVKLKVRSACMEQTFSKAITVLCPALDATVETQVNRQEVRFKAVGVPQEYITKWTFSDGGSTTEKEPVHTFKHVGKYTATLWLQHECGVKTILVDVDVTCGTLATDFNMAVAQVTVAFTPPASATPVTYLWDFGDGDKSTETTPVHNYHQSGKFRVCMTVTDACGAASVCREVEVHCEIPASTDFTYTVDKANPLLVNFKPDAYGSAARFRWSFGDGSVSEEAAPQHTYPATGQYHVWLVTMTDCRADSVYKSINMPTGIMDDVANKLISIFPNPVNEALHIEMAPAFASSVSSLTIYDALGRALISLAGGGAPATSTIDTRNLRPGIYYIRLRRKDGNYIIKKFVVRH